MWWEILPKTSALYSRTCVNPWSSVVFPILVTSVLLQAVDSSKPTVHMTVKPPAKLQYCSFFANRAPNIQLGLKNCTWFKENSCCRQKEIDAIFPRVKPLRGASPACQRYTNYLMCYVCAPNQGDFYVEESLSVCEEFCDSWYDACQNAILKGSVIKQLYSNGSEYCHSRRFKVQPAKKGGCFFFDAKLDKSRASHSYSTLALALSGLISLVMSFFVNKQITDGPSLL
ncbi:voltage-dependent calcium channel subunit alpha-2/delta-3-like [Plakobranchus ocellatus]|uniref:Voltage-dependent calcium channel subunit alpha-2/delta-3-like n=1 Tax=Plakobranchus ocellatus TaxID=259542 RepID=A0AAV4BGG0_9GAST|nr:voltage-dependent calcium channel subunit alpha-2/delta-3-like [Plakobranchus ocellatus]